MNCWPLGGCDSTTSTRRGYRAEATCFRVKRLAEKWGGSGKIEVNTVGLSLRFGTRRPRVQISPARPSRFETLKTADFDLVSVVWEGIGRGVGTAVENSWNLPN